MHDAALEGRAVPAIDVVSASAAIRTSDVFFKITDGFESRQPSNPCLNSRCGEVLLSSYQIDFEANHRFQEHHE